MIVTKEVKCKNCNNLKNGWCEKKVDSPDQYIVRDCCFFQKKTNADRIRAMSDEELAEFLCGVHDEDEEWAKFIDGYYLPYDQYSIKEWLKQPAEEGEDDL